MDRKTVELFAKLFAIKAGELAANKLVPRVTPDLSKRVNIELLTRLVATSASSYVILQHVKTSVKDVKPDQVVLRASTPEVDLSLLSHDDQYAYGAMLAFSTYYLSHGLYEVIDVTIEPGSLIPRLKMVPAIKKSSRLVWHSGMTLAGLAGTTGAALNVLGGEFDTFLSDVQNIEQGNHMLNRYSRAAWGDMQDILNDIRTDDLTRELVRNGKQFLSALSGHLCDVSDAWFYKFRGLVPRSA